MKATAQTCTVAFLGIKLTTNYLLYFISKQNNSRALKDLNKMILDKLKMPMMPL